MLINLSIHYDAPNRALAISGVVDHHALKHKRERIRTLEINNSSQTHTGQKLPPGPPQFQPKPHNFRLIAKRKIFYTIQLTI